MYSARITDQHRTAFLLLLDRSGSTAEPIYFGTTEMTKAEALAIIVNRFISELINHCKKPLGIRDYFDIAIIGYGDDRVCPLLSTHGAFTTPSELARQHVETRKYIHQTTLPNGQRMTTVSEVKYWLQPCASGSTPMRRALAEAEGMLRKWCRTPKHFDSYPPTVINITDGEASDADHNALLRTAEAIKASGTNDGNTIFYNIHLSKADDENRTNILFPASPEDLPTNKYARLLYEMSSILPQEQIPLTGRQMPKGSSLHTTGYNCTLDDIISMLNIGTISVNLNL